MRAAMKRQGILWELRGIINPAEAVGWIKVSRMAFWRWMPDRWLKEKEFPRLELKKRGCFRQQGLES